LILVVLHSTERTILASISKMDEKYAKYKTFPPRAAGSPMRTHARRAGRFRPLLVLTLVVVCLYLYARPSSLLSPLPDTLSRLSNTLQASAPAQGSAAGSGAGANVALVPLEAHVMSKCADARDCLQKLILPAMVRVVDKVNFTLSFIGTPTENDGIACKHGPEECKSASSLAWAACSPGRHPAETQTCGN
jgi:hypothetical protein